MNNEFGLSRENWTIIMEHAIAPLLKLGCRVWVFGSRANGTFNEFSDIDLLFESSEAIPLHLLSLIREELVNSDLPIKVDLVNRAELASSYRSNVDVQKVVINSTIGSFE